MSDPPFPHTGLEDEMLASPLMKKLDAEREALEVAEAAEAFILDYEFDRLPSRAAKRLVEAISVWSGVPLQIGRNGEGGYVVSKKE
jgi:hypothetical protein